MKCDKLPWYPMIPSVYYNGMSYYEDLAKLCGEMAQMHKWIEENLQGAIDQYFNSIMIDATYNEETETIVLEKELTVNGTSHTYNVGERSMSIT